MGANALSSMFFWELGTTWTLLSTTSSVQSLHGGYIALTVTLALRKGSRRRCRAYIFLVRLQPGASARCCNLCLARITLRAPWCGSLPEEVRHNWGMKQPHDPRRTP